MPVVEERESDFESRFGGVGRLYGRSALERLRAAHVCVVGVGGVGSWTAEALARTGVGEITLIDLDDVCITNVNRQLPALNGGIGRAKVDVLADRIALIHPGCKVHALTEYLTEGNAGALLERGYGCVVDAIDRVVNKCVIIAGCRDRGIPVVTTGGAGGKRDGTAVRTADLSLSTQDEMLRQTRRLLRREFGFPHIKGLFGVRCVFSGERPVYPWKDGTACFLPEPGSVLAMDCASGFGSAAHVTGAFGLAAAGEAIQAVLNAV